MKTLLQKAKELPVEFQKRKVRRTEEEIDIVLAFLKGEISNKQLAQVTGKHTGSTTQFIGSALLAAYRKGKIKIL